MSTDANPTIATASATSTTSTTTTSNSLSPSSSQSQSSPTTRTVIRKTPATTTTAHVNLSTATNTNTSSPTAAETQTTTPTDTTTHTTSVSPSQPTQPAAASSSAASLPVTANAAASSAPRPVSSLSSSVSSTVLPDDHTLPDVARLTEGTAKILVAQQKANATVQEHLSSHLQQQLQSLSQQQQKLAYIKQELLKLDQSLTDSIDILRTEIETVGRECLYAQSDFDRKEAAYLAARKELAKKKERKLLLTGHLDYIILNNEQEKAKKLAELERQLGLTYNPDLAVNGKAAGQAELSDSNNNLQTSTNEPQQPQQPAFSGFTEEEIVKFKL